MSKRYYDSERDRYDFIPVSARDRLQSKNAKRKRDLVQARINRSDSTRALRKTIALYSILTVIFGVLWSMMLYDSHPSQGGFLSWFASNWLTVLFLALLSALLVTVWARFGRRHNWNARTPRM